ncbi:MAG: response regulator transcription factor [Christensenellales bacterium]
MPERETKLLAADADATVREIIRLSAGEAGWQCDGAADGIAALKRLRRSEYHLVILEAELPEIDGFVVCRHLRKSANMPVMFISRDGSEKGRLEGFAVGGNDYVLKPFYPRELIARAKNLLEIWGYHMRADDVLRAGELALDTASRRVSVQGNEVKLTPKEYDLLQFFMRNQRQVFSRDALLEMVWGQDFFGSDRTVDTHVKSLRGKIHPVQHFIQTVWGYGYKFEP